MALLTVNGIIYVATDPELRFAPSGMAIASFRAVASKSKKNAAGEWENDKEMWFGVTAFGHLAEFVAEHVSKGDNAKLSGEIYEEEWETNEGEKRKTIKVIADGVNPLPKRDRSGGQQSSGGQQQRPQQQSQPSESPWGPPPGSQGTPWGAPQPEEPPF